MKKCFFNRALLAVTFLFILIFAIPITASNARFIRGDVNGDQEVNISDVTDLIDLLRGHNADNWMFKNADVNGDGRVTIDDVAELIDMILSDDELSIELSQDSVVLYVNQNLQLAVNIEPESSNYDVTWVSSNNMIAVVEDGLITAITPGECEIIVKCQDVMAICHVEVLDYPLESITLNRDYLTMDVNEVITLGVELTPSSIDGVPLVWKSTNESVASVNDGKITAKAPGLCEIIVSYRDKEASCQIAVLKKVDVNGVSFSMMPVKGGVFMMGSTMTQIGSNVNEKPQHEVTLSDYMIGVTEVTQELWQAVMGYTPGHFKGHPKRPVENVTWTDCETFINALNERTGLNFHLPTEAQWEYAARGGSRSEGYKFAGSDSIKQVAWYVNNSANLGSDSPDYGTHDVATKSPNELNIFDMCGNVNEWCYDWYSTYTSDPLTDPVGPATGGFKVFRGGSWADKAANCRNTFRYPQAVSYRSDRIGLRLAL